ncbi:MAG: DUF2807 domain-containing protein [Chitinophagales bacterium]|nr:DUF2807 domain-containing protein [Chitinophagales bacterium]
MKSNLINAALIVVVLVITSTSCKKDGWPCKNGDGSVQTEMRSVTGFTQIENETDVEVIITQGTEYEVKVQAQQNLLDEVMTEIKGDELQIYTKHCINKHEPIVVYVTMPALTKVEVSGSGIVTTTNEFNATNLSLVVSGSGVFNANDSIYTDAVDLTISGSGVINYLGESRNASAVVAGSGLITMLGKGNASDTGKPTNLDLTISGSGAVQAYDYPVEECHFTISGSGLGQVNVSTLLSGTISGSGSLMYKGNPALNVTIGGSGSVIHVD